MTHAGLARLARGFRPFALVAACAGLAFALWSEREGIAAFPWRLSAAPFALAVLAFSFSPFFGATSFWLIAREITGTARFRPSAGLWMRSFVARYVPSGALTVAVRVEGRDAIGASAKQVLLATVYEQGAAAIGGAAIAIAALTLDRGNPPLAAALILAGIVALVAVVPSAADRLRRLPVLQRLPESEQFPRKAVGLGGLACFGGWLFTGTAAWILVNALSPKPEGLFFVTGAYAFSWLLGFVIVFAPSGLGVREATFVALLAPSLGAGPATAIALILRFANTVGDLVAVGLTLAVMPRRAAPLRWARACRGRARRPCDPAAR